MSFTGSDIKAAVETYSGMTLSESDALLAINEALARIGTRAMATSKENIVATANTPYDLPVDCVDIMEVLRSDGSVYTAWRVRGGEIIFLESDTYTIYYRTLPTLLANLVDYVTVPDIFREPIITYVRAWQKLQDDDESQDGLRLLMQFELDVAQAFRTLRAGLRGPTSVKVVR